LKLLKVRPKHRPTTIEAFIRYTVERYATRNDLLRIKSLENFLNVLHLEAPPRGCNLENLIP